jgi:hypothetical protein
MSWMEDSSDREEIATYERISLNNLLLKSKGAPYEDALRRIIEVRLQQNLRVSLQESSVDEVDCEPNLCLPLEKKPSSQESYIENIPSISVSHQLGDNKQACKREDFMNDIDERRSLYGESLSSGSTSSTSRDEFQRWMLKSNGLDLHHEDQVYEAVIKFETVDSAYLVPSHRLIDSTLLLLPQCQSWLRHISRVQQGSALPPRRAESRNSAEGSRNKNIDNFEKSDNDIHRSSIVQKQQSNCTRIKGQSCLDNRNRNRGLDADRPEPHPSLSLLGGQRSNPTDREIDITKIRSSSNYEQLDGCNSRSLSSSYTRRSGSECGDAVSSTTTDSPTPRSVNSSRSSSRGKAQAMRGKQSSCRLQDDVPARYGIKYPQQSSFLSLPSSCETQHA